MKLGFNKISTVKDMIEVSIDGGTSSIYVPKDEALNSGYELDEQECLDLSDIQFSGKAKEVPEYTQDQNTEFRSALRTVDISGLEKYLTKLKPNTNGVVYNIAVTGVTDNDLTSSGNSGSLGSLLKNTSRTLGVRLPDTVTSIGENAFDGCSNVTSITIPSTVTSIMSNAFKDCSSLTAIDYKGSKEDWSKITVSSDSGVTDSTMSYTLKPHIKFTVKKTAKTSYVYNSSDGTSTTVYNLSLSLSETEYDVSVPIQIRYSTGGQKVGILSGTWSIPANSTGKTGSASLNGTYIPYDSVNNITITIWYQNQTSGDYIQLDSIDSTFVDGLLEYDRVFALSDFE